MFSTIRAYSKHRGDLFYEESSLKGVLAEHLRISVNCEVLKQVDFADRDNADFILFQVQASAQDTEFDIYGDWINLPAGVSHLGFYKSVAADGEAWFAFYPFGRRGDAEYGWGTQAEAERYQAFENRDRDPDSADWIALDRDGRTSDELDGFNIGDFFAGNPEDLAA
jgi:hypothetical protein